MRKLIVTEFISVDGFAEVEKLPSVTGRIVRLRMEDLL